MISFCRVSLDGLELTEEAPSILALDMRCAPVYTSARGITAGDPGVERMEVALTLEAHEADPAARQRALERALGWASRGGWLRAAHLPGRRLYIDGWRPGTGGSVLRWQERVQLVLSAAALPYWEDEPPRRASLRGRQARASVQAPGYAAPAYVSCRVTAEGALTGLTLGAGDTRIRLEGLSVPPGGAVEIAYGMPGHLLAIRGPEGQSLLERRTAESSDELRMEPGRRGEVYVEADTEVNAQFQIRGLYL